MIYINTHVYANKERLEYTKLAIIRFSLNMIRITSFAAESVGSNEVNERERSIQKASLQVKSFAENMENNTPWDMEYNLPTIDTGWEIPPNPDSLAMPPPHPLRISPSSYMAFPSNSFNNYNAGNGQLMTPNTSHSQSASDTTQMQWSNPETISLLNCFIRHGLRYIGISKEHWDDFTQMFNFQGYNRTATQIRSKMTLLARDFGNWKTNCSQLTKSKQEFFLQNMTLLQSVFPDKHRTPEFMTSSATQHAQEMSNVFSPEISGSSKKRGGTPISKHYSHN